MKTLFRVLSLFFICNLFNVASNAQTLTVYDNPCNAGDCNTKRFEVVNIATQFGNHIGDYRFFLYVGDGTYYDVSKQISNLTEGIQIDHTYKADGNYEVYLETVPRYEDDLPPKRFNYPNDNGPIGKVNVTCGTLSNCSSTASTLATPLFKVKMNRDLVPGDIVSYIITYAHTCQKQTLENLSGIITVEFNSDQISPEMPSFHYDIQDADVDEPPMVSNTGMVNGTWTFKNLEPDQSGHIILPMIVNGDMQEDDEIEINFKLQYFESSCADPGDIKITKTVRNSHDPNNLDSDKIFTCDIIDTDTVKYTIRFQNFGDAPADTVIIKDIIPEYFNINSIQAIYPNDADATRSIIIRNREVRWVLYGNKLRGSRELHGTTEPGFGSAIYEEHTIDSLVFLIARDTDATLDRCDAIINRAEIIFDCNPSIFTEPHVLRFGCLDSLEVNPLPPDTINNPNGTSSSGVQLSQIIQPQDSFCNQCSEISFIKSLPLEYIDQAVQMTINTALLHGLNEYEFLWYPSEGLTSHTIMEPFASPQKTTEYFLIASKPDSCLRRIYRKTVNVACGPLVISPTVTCVNGVKSIKATVNSTSPHLKWQDCTFGSVFSDSGMDNEFMKLSVVDTLTNCSATLSVRMKCPDPPGKLIWWVVGSLAALLVIGLLYYYSGWPP